VGGDDDEDEDALIAEHMAHNSNYLWDDDPVRRDARLAASREKKLAEYRVKRAARIAELGLGSHRRDP
jgi:hypothetical protein